MDKRGKSALFMNHLKPCIKRSDMQDIGWMCHTFHCHAPAIHQREPKATSQLMRAARWNKGWQKDPLRRRPTGTWPTPWREDRQGRWGYPGANGGRFLSVFYHLTLTKPALDSLSQLRDRTRAEGRTERCQLTDLLLFKGRSA